VTALTTRAASVFRFGTQDRQELAPARIGDTPVQSGLGCDPVEAANIREVN
jgi:hypothetical protein